MDKTFLLLLTMHKNTEAISFRKLHFNEELFLLVIEVVSCPVFGFIEGEAGAAVQGCPCVPSQAQGWTPETRGCLQTTQG